ncbi:TetR family transcriptional regulator [Actinotalea sp. BY-33]|uniref:TetR family transcriptional regulator n=1 Tax=Actinotalea soli TaxID=2819234 RepID=A0A939LWH0_9CELL|nr:TetR family transcriptional regulator [Actinotalea soli]MBO1753439.1 TetR family transcriptional regulator [Actinotalea soli]
MRSASAAEDSTARARIRDAAVLRFSREGFRASLRTIAQEAGVSAALVVHHFGSKDGLREACDEHVLAVIREQKRDAVGPTGPTQLLARMAELDEWAPLVGYALRSMQAGGDLARAFLDHFAADAEEYLREGVAAGTILASRDEVARARYLTVMGYGAFLLDIALHPPEDPADLRAYLHGYLERTGLPAMELFTQGLFTDRSMLDAYLMYVTDPPAEG